jgi:hypothetical protein
MKAGERQEVVDRASQKGLPRIGFDKNNCLEQPNPWPNAHMNSTMQHNIKEEPYLRKQAQHP